VIGEGSNRGIDAPRLTSDGAARPNGREDAVPADATWPRRTALLSLVFGLFGAALMFLGDGSSRGSRSYTGTPQFKVWAVIIIGIIASLPVVWHVGMDLLGRLGLSQRKVLRARAAPALMLIVIVVVAALLAGEFARGKNPTPVAYGLARIGIIYALGVTAAVPAFLTLWECYGQLANVDSAAASDIFRLLLLRECLLSALTTIGLLISAGILATGAERQASLADAKYTAPYPAAYVLIWGAAFSALLVVNFLPAFRRLVRRVSMLIDAILPILPPGTHGWQSRLQERKDLAELLKVTGSVRDAITSAVLVAAPLITSVFSLVLPGGSK
jgi:hypothetical protein